MNKKIRALLFGILALTPVVNGCSSADKPDGRLLDSEESTYDITAEEERLRKMQAVRLIQESDGEVIEVAFEDFVEGESSLQHLAVACDPLGNVPDVDVSEDDNWQSLGMMGFIDESCSPFIACTLAAECMGDTLRSIASVRSPTATILGGYIVPPQSEATNARLLEHSAYMDQWRMKCAHGMLNEEEYPTDWGSGFGLDICTDIDTTPVSARLGGTPGHDPYRDMDDVTVAEFAADHFLDAYWSGRESLEDAAKAHLAVAAGQRGSTPDDGLSSSRSQSGSSLSRAKASHVIIGGVDGIEGNVDNPLCSAGSLTAQEKAALQIFRQVGISPTEVLNDQISIIDLVENTTAEGSVKSRLEYFEHLLPQSVEKTFGLTLGDFATARKYLRQEIRAFARSLEAKIWTHPLEDTGGFDKFAGTSTVPSVPDVYWMALALTEHPVASTEEQGAGPWANDAAPFARPEWPINHRAPNLAELLRYGDLATGELAESYQATVYPPVVALAKSIQAKGDYEGEIYECDYGTNFTKISVRIKSPDIVHTRLYLVSGEDALRCAVSGSIEGARCDSNTIAFSQYGAVSPMTDITSPFADDWSGEWANAGTFTFDETFGRRVYLLEAENDAPSPGQYRALAGFRPYRGVELGLSGDQCRSIPFGAEVRRLTTQALAPSPDHCTLPMVECDGTFFDERMPLENELSEDGDGVESSWRHYLNLARDAAFEADQLAQQFIDSEVSVEEAEVAQNDRAIAALEELQTVCGTAADVGVLLDKLTEGTGSRDLGACPTPPNEPGEGEVCIGGRLIADLETWLDGDPELESLKTCLLSASATEPWVHLGGAGESSDKLVLCAWQDAAGEILCEGAVENGVQCPSVFSGSKAVAECGTWIGELAALDEFDGIIDVVNKVVLTPDHGIGLFDTIETLPSPPPVGTCDKIRKLRTERSAGTLKEGSDELNSIIESGLFNSERMMEERSRLTLEANYGGFLKVLVDGQELISTGGPVTGLSSGWPCETSLNPHCDEKEGLFCEEINCDLQGKVQEFSDRIARAVVAAHAISFGEGSVSTCDLSSLPWWDAIKCINEGSANADTLKAFQLPVYLHEGLTVADADPGGDTWIIKFVRDNTANNGIFELAPSGIPLPFHVGPFGFKVLDSASATNEIAFELGPNSDYLREELFDGITYRPVFLKRNLAGLLPTNYDYFLGGMGTGAFEKGALRQLLEGERYADVQLDNEWIAARQKPSLDIGFEEPESAPDLPCTLSSSGGVCFEAPTCQQAFACQEHTDDFRERSINAREDWMEALGLTNHRPYPSFAFDYGEAPVRFRFDDYETGAFSEEALLDGLELLCEVAAEGGGGCGEAPPPFESAADLGRIGKFMRCQGDRILHHAATSVFEDFPVDVLNPLNEGGAVDSSGGTLSEAFSNLKIALTEVALAGPTIGRTVRQLGYDMKDLHEEMIRLNLRSQMDSIAYQSTVAQNFTACIAAMSSSMWDPVAAAAAGVSQAATCANSFIQNRLADQLRDLQDEESDSAVNTAVNEFNRRVDGISSTLEEQQLLLSSSLEEVAKQLGIIESERARAGRSLNRALWYLSDDGTALDAHSAVRDLYRVRYESAHNRAKKLAFLAKRAIENRIGVKLRDIRESLPLVESPHSWESTVCETSPLDFQRLKEADGDEDLRTFADSFIGEYVAKLENLVESYRLEYGFKEGADTAVVSLRDDIMQAREACLVEGPNLLRYSGQLDNMKLGVPADGEWGVEGCVPDAEGELPKCASVRIAETTAGGQTVPEHPFSSGSKLAGVMGYDIAFGEGDGSGCSGCSWVPNVVVGQRLQLDPGIYRFSWYSPETQTGAEDTGIALVDGVAASRFSEGYNPGGEFTWGRYDFTFEVDQQSDVLVGFTSVDDLTVTVGAPMLEKVGVSGDLPGIYVDTLHSTDIELEVCPDLDGDVFRSRWTQGCDLICADGYASDCRGHATKACYWETSFHITQRAIEAGEQFAAAGFAKGNFNYRLDRVALNFVGTGLRDCLDSLSPETCYGSGFVPYSLEHSGPFYVRNHFGNDYRAHLFNGVIEHARGLGAERYISNPIASADRDQLEQFTRLEMQGRPLDGSFVVRVWDEPGVNFDAIQDVQVVLDYRYWTRN